MYSTNQIRTLFLDFFKSKEHAIVPSSSLVPDNDPTLLFTNAGMVQFKDVFLGKDNRPYVRATSAQRCVRAGGKHNDLERVGYTARHHTFFEMLGNFSFGDYFKREAIQFAWEFLTKVVKLPPERLWVTVYEKDQESEDIWLKELKIDPKRFSRCGEKDNFWAMADTGPCGPCTEIFYDHGPSIAGGPPGSKDADGDRYVEIWNLVFMQYDRNPEGKLVPLPKPSVDTGMGLERIAAVLQGVHSNYEIDLFQQLITTIRAFCPTADKNNPSLKVIADHIRSASFLAMDGIIPSNEGRGYVLRRIIRRALRHGNKLGIEDAFFYRLVDALVFNMGEAFPELKKRQLGIEKILQQEEQQFSRTLAQGLAILEGELPKLKKKTIPGDLLFRLYDTYGFPVDLVEDIAREKGLSLDMSGFETEMTSQRQRARAASNFQTVHTTRYQDTLPADIRTDFKGYERTEETAQVIAVHTDAVILNHTPFYAEGGGQVGDTGVLESKNAEFTVTDTQKNGNIIVHLGTFKQGNFKVGEHVTAKVDETRRQAIRLNHSATHLLHSALHQIIGREAMQKGSLVHPDYLRFDFAYDRALTKEQLMAIEDWVNKEIRHNAEAKTTVTSPDEAKKIGALGLFEGKYGDKVRVLQMGEFSKELCGGTHVSRTGDIGLFKITSEAGIAAGVRRIEAVTGEIAIHVIRQQQEELNQKIAQLIEQNKQQEKLFEQLQTKIALASKQGLLNKVQKIGDINVLMTSVEGVDIKNLRTLADELKQQLDKAVILLGTVEGQKVSMIASVSKNCIPPFHAGELVQFASQLVGGKGGGRPDMAQGGGSEPNKLPEALRASLEWIKKINK